MERHTTPELQFERCHPARIREALARRALVYLPLGSYEWHGEHLPVGLDALKAHQLCLRAAERTGGLVCPPFFYGTGGEHAAYPWTMIVEREDVLIHLITFSLRRLRDFGVRLAVLFSGHYAREQVAMLTRLGEEWNAERSGLRVLTLNDSMLPDPPIPPDHAGLFETSLMGALEPGLVKLERLPNAHAVALGKADSLASGGDRHHQGHPLYGIFGLDPRPYDAAEAGRLLKRTVDWLANEVERATLDLGLIQGER